MPSDHHVAPGGRGSPSGDHNEISGNRGKTLGDHSETSGDRSDAPGKAAGEAQQQRPTSLRLLPQIIGGALRLVWAASPPLFVACVGLKLANAAGLAAALILSRDLIGAVLATDGTAPGVGVVTPQLVAVIGILGGLGLVTAAGRELRVLLAETTARHAKQQIIDVTARVELTAYETPAFHGCLGRVTSGEHRPSQLVDGIVNTIGAFAGIGAIVVALLTIQPWLVPLLFLAGLPLMLGVMKAGQCMFGFHMRVTDVARARSYLFRLLTEKDPAKEVRAFGLGDHLTARHTVLYDQQMAELRRTTLRRFRIALASIAGLSVTVGAAVAGLLALALSGHLELAETAAAAGALFTLGERIMVAVNGVGDMYEAGPFVEDLTAFLATAPATAPATDRATGRSLGAQPARATQPTVPYPDPPQPSRLTLPTLPTQPGRAAPPTSSTRPTQPVRATPASAPAPATFDRITVENVAFTYPAASRPALRDVSLEITAGQVVALVGENGSGKTTLAKLLSRLYLPQCGVIAWDGVDTAGLDADQLRRRIAVIFQDFARYELTGRENIGLGAVERLDDRDAILAAARHAGADRYLGALPNGYETVLSPDYAGGRELSGGQWQRVAVARAFIRDAPLIILDEPTAALDPRAEHDLIGCIRSLYAGRTVLLISHRFNTVRDADHIYVLDDGQIIEHGNHDQLTAADGVYAELFALQAAAYADRPPADTRRHPDPRVAPASDAR